MTLSVITMKLIDLKTLSKETSLSIFSVRKYIKNEGMPFYRIGRKILVDPNEIEIWLKQYKTINQPADLNLKHLVKNTIKKLGIHSS